MKRGPKKRHEAIPLPAELIEIDYVNWRGRQSTRQIKPIRLIWGSNEWHPTPQWIVEAIDCEKGDVRGFAVRGIKSWSPVIAC